MPLTGLAVALLVWLVASGRYTFAMMLAAFMLPVLVQAAPRWRVFLGPLNDPRSGFPPITPDLSPGGGGARHAAPSGTPEADPRLVQQSIAVLRAYIEQSGLQIEKPAAESRSAMRQRGAPAMGGKACRLRKRSTCWAEAGCERRGHWRGASPSRSEARSETRRNFLSQAEDRRGAGRAPRGIGWLPRRTDMSWGRIDRWLLVRLAAQNVGRRRLRATFLGVAVMLGVGVGFASFVAGWALREGIASNFLRMGADLVVVPRATLVNITASLLTVQPTDATLAADLERKIAAISGVARIAPQRIVPTMVDGQTANLIAFDPARDFSVLT
ncbi:MAG: hypothetical protein R3D52_00560 [Xanthobacteraceae bacterium]